MRRVGLLLTTASVVLIGACVQRAPGLWFKGDLDAAQSAAKARGTLVMLEFYTDWCAWCRRLESDTFSVPEVREEISQLVALKLNAEKGGADLAERFDVDSYPTLIFLDSTGREVDRIHGYLPPDKFIQRVHRIRKGDTFLACLRELKEDPGDLDAIRRSVDGLLQRSDPEGAISRLEAFHEATEGRESTLCRRLMFAARIDLHQRVYVRAAKIYRRGWDRNVEVPNTTGTERLHALAAEDFPELPAEEQAIRLREARFEDAAAILAVPDLDSAAPDDFIEVAGFAFSNGHYDVAAELYLHWYEAEGDEASGLALNDVAWRLYLSGKELEAATEISRRAYELKGTPEVADTLARLLYIRGSEQEAIALEKRAAEAAGGTRGETYRAIAEQMEAREVLGDQPSFDSYPGRRRTVL